MSLSETHPCPDERCAIFLTDSDDPFMCLHYANNAEAIEYWGRVARDEMEPNEVIEEYREFLDFDTATSIEDHFDEDYNWQGPTVEIEVRVDNTPVKTFTAYPVEDSRFHPSFTRVLRKALGYVEGWEDAVTEGKNGNTDE